MSAFAAAREELGPARRRLRRRRRQRPPLRRRSAARGQPRRGGTPRWRSTPRRRSSAAREAVRWMLDQEPDDDGLRGSIVLMSSVSAVRPGAELFGTHAYAAAKASILGLAKIAAAYYVGARHPRQRPRSRPPSPRRCRAAGGRRPGDGRLPARQAAARRRHARRRRRRRRRRVPVQPGEPASDRPDARRRRWLDRPGGRR